MEPNPLLEVLRQITADLNRAARNVKAATEAIELQARVEHEPQWAKDLRESARLVTEEAKK